MEVRSPSPETLHDAARAERLVGRWGLPIVVLLSLLWRLPSLWDPPWVNDEGTYFALAGAMAHGYRLYADLWENKPPLIYLLYGVVYHPFGPSLVGIRLVATIAVLCTVALIYGICRVFATTGPSLAGSLLAGLLFGVPVLEGTTANAEVFLAALTALAVWLVLRHQRYAAAGACMGIAVLFKAVAACDMIALGLYVLSVRRPALPRYGLAGFVVLMVAGLWAAAAGILPAMLRDALLYDIGYVGHANGGRVPWLLVGKVVVLGALTIRLRGAPFPVLWLVYAGFGALFSGRIFGHYLLQTIPSLAVCCTILLARWRIPAVRALVTVPLAFIGLGLVSAVVGWVLIASGHDSILARRLQYYANVARYALHTETASAYRDQIDDHVNRNLAVVRAVKSLPPGRLLVWGNTPWIYVLSGRLPSTPYTSALRTPEVPDESRALRDDLIRRVPEVVVLISPPMPALGSAGCALYAFYRPVRSIRDAGIWVRRHRPARCPPT